MTFPSTVGSDSTDPDSQIPWPGRRGQSHSPVTFREPLTLPLGDRAGEGRTRAGGKKISPERGGGLGREKTMTLKDFVYISISMAGAQIAWTIELGYGTPFLLSLGLSEQITSLVWLAGPISGLIAQPLIGALSDSSTSKYRRRFWIATSTLVLVVSTLSLAYAKEIASVIVDIFGGGQGDWDSRRNEQVRKTAIGLAVTCFYLLDFALNALQASLRNLLLDITPAQQLATGNAWHGRMTHAGNIIGYTLGFVNLTAWPIIRDLGGDQFRKFCVVAMVILAATVWITCYTQEETAREEHFTSNKGNKLREALSGIAVAIKNLPRPIQRVCFVQVFAFMGWFPFLFYSTTWVGEVMAYEIGADPSTETATRAGEFALLLYSIVSVVAGTLLPHFASRDRRLMAAHEGEEEDEEITRIREMVRSWKAEAARAGRPLRLPTMPFMLRNIWTAALVLFGVVMASTFFISTVFQATVAISVLGICWAVACWVPFAIIMEFLKESDQEREAPPHPGYSAVGTSTSRPTHSRVASSPALWRGQGRGGERTRLIRRLSLRVESEEVEAAAVAGGTILGIHNLAIVFPQFLVAIVSSSIFRIADHHQPPGHENDIYYGKNGVAWVLRFGGFCALLGAFVSRKVPPTNTEKAMRRRLAEMKESDQGGSP